MKKLTKKLFIASSLVLPIVAITPVVLTSCSNLTKDESNDESPNNPNKPNGGKISINSDVIKNLKIKKNFIDLDGKNRDVFWLNTKNDFRSYNNVNSSIAKLYKQIVTDKEQLIKKDLIDKEKFEYVELSEKDENAIKESFIKNGKFEYNPSSGNVNNEEVEVPNFNYKTGMSVVEKENLSVEKFVDFKDLLKGIEFTNEIYKPIEEGESFTAAKLNGDDLNFDILKDQVDINVRLTLSNFKDRLYNDVIAKSNQCYFFEVILKPKFNYYWDFGNDDQSKNQIPLVLTIFDYIDNVNIFKNQIPFSSNREIANNDKNIVTLTSETPMKDIKEWSNIGSAGFMRFVGYEIGRYGIDDSFVNNTNINVKRILIAPYDYTKYGYYPRVFFHFNKFKDTSGNSYEINPESMMDAIWKNKIAVYLSSYELGKIELTIKLFNDYLFPNDNYYSWYNNGLSSRSTTIDGEIKLII